MVVDVNEIQYKTAAVLFGGIGGESAGLLQSQVEFGGKIYRFKLLCSIDSDPVANRNHDLITGEKTAVTIDLFQRWQYEAWHGHAPPDDWQEVTAWDVWQAFREQVPFFLFLSPPCKGLSGLLPQEKSASAKYQALNYLTVHGLELALQACLEYGGKLPAIIQLENVPRITSRGKPLLKKIKKLLEKYGYAVSIRADHNLGEIGGLGQNRVRFLIVARHEAQIPNVIYYPKKKPIRTIGDIIKDLPAPGDTEAGGPLHGLPRLQWKTWLRLALIRAGGDWRDLNFVDFENLRVAHEPRSGAFGVADWNKASGAVTGTAGPGRSNGVTAVSDPRLQINGNGKSNLFRIQSVDSPAMCVTGAVGPNQGAGCIADPALTEKPGRHPAQYRVISVDQPAPCVTGTRFGSGAIAIADSNIDKDPQIIEDLRLYTSPRADTMGVQKWDQPSKTVTGSMDVHAGAAAIADPRPIPKDNEKGIWTIISLDGTWHRPMTTYELAMLQSFPTHLPDGRPFQLEGCTDAKAREYIGNAVPRDSSIEMGNMFLLAAAEAEAQINFSLSWDPIWVAPEEEYTELIH
ncbi:DNA cytosine methyltransferase [Paenibacillus sp. GCM10012307]|uniref:DNA cytosine methyltransferase n=1 Tax=Paenibacillus roseus TaxID=2798579 RepID=A0A934MUY4_9BACL|nr:DNA cytosine methyltransferase [Paenibacillus roseus]MBJ6361557.1 DNA cytosine methyltransferase [Paenibacillus roseus]